MTSNITTAAEKFSSIFRGRPDAWGAVTGRCVYEPVTLAHLERHLAGKVSHGQYPLLNDNTCWWITADFDQQTKASWHRGRDDDTPAHNLIEVLVYYGANQGLYLEKTKEKGWRVWLFFSTPVLAKDVRRLFFAAFDKAKLPRSIEVFPKQDVIAKPTPQNTHPVGNYVNLPYFGGGPSGPRKGRVFVDLKAGAPIPLQQLLSDFQTLYSDAMPLILDNLPKERPQAKLGHKPDEIVAMLSKPLAVGERRPTLIKIAGYLRFRGIPEEVAVALLLPWAERCFAESLPQGEVESHIRGIYGRYGERRKLGKGGVSLDVHSIA